MFIATNTYVHSIRSIGCKRLSESQSVSHCRPSCCRAEPTRTSNVALKAPEPQSLRAITLNTHRSPCLTVRVYVRKYEKQSRALNAGSTLNVFMTSVWCPLRVSVYARSLACSLSPLALSLFLARALSLHPLSWAGPYHPRLLSPSLAPPLCTYRTSPITHWRSDPCHECVCVLRVYVCHRE